MNLSHFVVAGLLSLASFFGYHQPAQTTNLGASFTPVGGQTYYLAGAGITATQNTIQLTSFQTPDGRSLAMSMFGSIGYAALEPGTSKLEDVTFSGITQNSNGTATLTGVTRGNDFVSPYAASSTLAKAHAGGSTFILSNTAGFYGQQFLFSNNVGSSTATLTFSNTAPPFYYPGPGVQSNGSAIATTSEFASVAYVNALVTAGAPNASQSVKGLVQIATAAQTASSTNTGSTGAILAIPASIATDTPNTTNKSDVLMSDLTGHLKQGWLDLTQAFTFSGGLTSSGAFIASAAANIIANSGNKLTLDTVAYAFPSSQGVANSRLVNDGSGNLSWGIGSSRYNYATSTAISTINTYATTTQFMVPIAAGLLTASSTIHVVVQISDTQGQNSGGGTFYLRDAAGDTLSSCGVSSTLSSGGQSGFCTFDIYMNNSVSSQIDSFYQSVTGGAGNSSEASVGTTAFNLGGATSLYGVIITTSSSVSMTLSSMVVSITP